MSTIRKHKGNWQCLVRIKDHPHISKSFKKHDDAKRWGNEIELKIRREDAGIAKIKYPSFNEIGLRYIADVSITKKGFVNERNIIKSLFLEPFSAYPINKITPDVIGKFRDRQLTSITGTSINRKLDVISTIFTTCKKEWGYPVPNPVLSIRRPKKNEPRNRRLTEAELSLLIRGNHTTEVMRTIMQIMLETGMRSGEIVHISHDHLKGKKFAKICKKYSIKDAVPHDLRHNSLSDFMRVKNLNVPETMLIAGHKDPRMLLRIYNNIQVEHVAEKLNKS